MAQTNDLRPPIDSSVEQLTIGFDFSAILTAGETISSVTSLTCSAYLGSDAAASSRLIGGSTIIASLTGKASAAVAQQVGNMLAGVTYRLQCVVLTSKADQLSLWTHFQCVLPT